MIGGETEAMQRLKKFATECEAQPHKGFKNGSRDSIYGANFSCKISPWLTMGCLSPRTMFDELKKTARRYALRWYSCNDIIISFLNMVYTCWWIMCLIGPFLLLQTKMTVAADHPILEQIGWCLSYYGGISLGNLKSVQLFLPWNFSVTNSLKWKI